MVAIAEFTVPADALGLGSLFEAFPDATVEVERVVPTGDGVMPYLWVEGADGEAVAAALSDSAAVESVVLVDAVGDRTLLRCRYADPGRLLDAVAESGATMLSATGTADGWTIQVRGDERRAVAAFDEACRARGVVPTLWELEPGREGGGADALTEPQREALALAYDRGYFDEPRRATLEEIAVDLDISRQALASRLRRGHRALIAAHVVAAER
ncbi:bacterio-opsin activator domain-containing protein [Haloarcula litorea]|uniref:helix-turn-helix domain-containing protein n=1 Tax=Haloarcula litorea TaxID=3032579 RepID=UPI0023E8B53E|nr:bacterio-opsin activator domain-containing protein [Halomicroarcula sp. GDY20]